MFGMPPMFPVAIAMAFELATYGAVTGIIYKLLPKKSIYTYITLIIAMLAGRAVWGTVMTILLGMGGKSFTWAAFVAGGFVNAIPGIILQIILIPILIIALKKARFIEE